MTDKDLCAENEQLNKYKDCIRLVSLEGRDSQSGEGRRGSRGKKVGKGREKESMKEEEKTWTGRRVK